VTAEAPAISTPVARGGSPTAGAALCLVSAAGFGAMAIFGKLAYDAGVTVLTLLFVRFALAGAVFGGLLVVHRALWVRGLGRRQLAIGLGLGAVYALQAGLYFAALDRLDASLLALLLYTYPAWVTLAAFGIGRERPTRRRIVALALSSAGLVVVLAGAGGGGVDALGVALALGAAFAYTGYILVSDGSEVVNAPFLLSALVCGGATAIFALAGVVGGAVDTGFEAEGWLWLGLIALVSTVLPISTFFAGLARVGPSTASILSTLEPVVTVTLAYLAFSERLTLPQLGGAALVVAAAAMLAMPARRPAPPA
jgi:drug/metabolite transporter (DMT)-like permease